MRKTKTNKSNLISRFMAFIAILTFANLYTQRVNAGVVCSHTVAIAKVNPTCFGDCDGSLTANPSPAGGSYGYLWSNSETTKTISNLCAGTYTVTVTDLNTQCSIVKSATIKKGKVSVKTTLVNATCGQCNGSITLIGQGGNGGPYTYLWSTGATTSTITDVCPNVNYTLTVTDRLGCTFVCHKKVRNVGVSVDDNNECTVDGCDPVTGLPTHTPVVCDDNNACTDDACDPLIGCTYTPITCDDGNICTDDACDPAIGCTYTPVTCDDGDPCTDDSCDPASGCVYTPNDNCCDNDFTTYTQGGWHNTGAPGQYLVANFDNCATDFVLGDACGFTITFTSAAEIQEFLPQGGPAGALTQSQTDPGSGDITVLAGQVLANGLALLFDDCDADFSGSDDDLGDMIYVNAASPFDGWSIQAIYDTARKALSGCPTLYDFSALNDACTAINENYDGGANNGNFVCPSTPSRLAGADAKVLSAYPNPFNNMLTISVTSDEVLTVKITDVSGRLIAHFDNVTSTFEVQNNWKQGMYFITLRNESGSYQEVIKAIRAE